MEHQYTQNNHFKWGYNKRWFTERVKPQDRYTVEFGVCEREPLDFGIECFHAAELIDRYAYAVGTSIELMYSGGSESEVMLRSFIEQGFNVNVNIMTYDPHLNLHDIAHAIVFCETNNIDYVLHEVPIMQWLHEEGLKYANISKSITPRILPHMLLMERLAEGIPVMGMGECYLAHGNLKQYYDLRDGKIVRNDKDDFEPAPWYFYEREKINSWYRFAAKKNIRCIPGFFQYTPELMLSFLREDVTKQLVNNEMFGKLSNTSTKTQIYNKHFPGILQKKKYDGFEMLGKMDEQLRPTLQQEYGMYSQEVKIEYNELIKQLEGK
tara:strand:+ start:4292 stop:5260 length:969 start_codon:yes stop_codon:yes gene_type:complete